MQAPAGVIALQHGPWMAWVLPHGARLMQLWWLAAPGKPRPLTLGFQSPDDYRSDRMSIGAVCGRYANRIEDATLRRGAQSWSLNINHPMGHCIHGGTHGFGVIDWEIETVESDAVTLVLRSPSGDQGFPGECVARVRYALDSHGLSWQATAEVDRPCPINLVQHSYWNLAASPTLVNHTLQVNASTYLPVDARELPMPAAPVDGSCYDFRRPTPLRAECFPLLDGALVLGNSSGKLRRVAQLASEDLAMTVSTDQPYLHLYAAAKLTPSQPALGVTHGPGAGLCMETEDCPNGPALGKDVWYGPERPYQHTLRLDFEPLL